MGGWVRAGSGSRGHLQLSGQRIALTVSSEGTRSSTAKNARQQQGSSSAAKGAAERAQLWSSEQVNEYSTVTCSTAGRRAGTACHRTSGTLTSGVA